MKLLVFIIAVCFLITANSCKKGCHVKATDGIEKCKKNETCVDDIEIMKLGSGGQDDLVINDDSTYKDLFGFFPSYSIDFTTQTLLVTTIGHGGCGGGTYSYKVTKDNEKKEYTLQIRVRENGECWMYFSITYEVAIPKIEDDYTVSFSDIINTCKRASS